jgi:small nuclear ribonucleoprotein (snRNP)-like protein
MNEEVKVELKNGDVLSGVLKAYDPDTFSILLENASIKGEMYKVIMVNGNVISMIYLKEKKVDMERLAKRLEEYFPRLVEYKRPLGVILVMNKIRVTENGVEGEPGPAYDRVKKIYDEFVKGR